MFAFTSFGPVSHLASRGRLIRGGTALTLAAAAAVAVGRTGQHGHQAGFVLVGVVLALITGVAKRTTA
jgi:hypothetical protein